MGSRFSRIAAPLTGVLAVLAAVGFVLAAPRLLDVSGDQAAIPAPPAGTGEVASVVAPLRCGPPGHPGADALGRPGEAPRSGGATPASPTGPATPRPSRDRLPPSVRAAAGSPRPRSPESAKSLSPRTTAAPAMPRRDHKAHHAHHGHGKGHEHHGNGQGVGHSGDENGDQHDSDHGKHDNGKHNGATKPKKDPPPKSNHSLGSGHGHGKKSDRERRSGRQAREVRSGALILIHGRGADSNDLEPLLDILDPDRRLLGIFPRGPLSLPPGGRHWYVVREIGFPDADTFLSTTPSSRSTSTASSRSTALAGSGQCSAASRREQ